MLFTNPANISLFKVNNGNTKKSCGICSNLTIETPVWPQCRSGVFFVNFEYISHLFHMFLQLPGTSKCFLGEY